jgi:hypothetical protein
MSQQGFPKQTALAPVSQTNNELSLNAIQAGEIDVFRLGDVLSKSGYFSDAKEAAQCIVKVLAGRELGFGAIASMTGIYIVKGRISLSANLIAAAIKRSGRYDYRVKRIDDKACEIEFFEKNQTLGISSFTAEDAKRAKLDGGENYSKFGRNMFYARAMSNGAKWFCPDVFNGPVYTPEELGAPTDGDGMVIVGASSIARTPEVVTPPAADTPEVAEIKERVRAACVELGYDPEKQEKALKKLAGKTPDEMCKALGSLIKLRDQNAAIALREKIEAEFGFQDWDENDVARYLREGFGGVPLKEMSLDQLQSVFDDLGLNKGGGSKGAGY